jgi:hypothetical protein
MNSRSSLVRLGLVLRPPLPIPPATAFDFLADELILAGRELGDTSSHRQSETLGDLDNHRDADTQFTSELEDAQALLHDRPSGG